MINQTRAVDKLRLINKIGYLSVELMGQVNQALKLHYDLQSNHLNILPRDSL